MALDESVELVFGETVATDDETSLLDNVDNVSGSETVFGWLVAILGDSDELTA